MRPDDDGLVDSAHAVQAEVAVVGAGAAGLALATRLAAGRMPGVVLVEAPAGHLTAPERTWCSWQVGPGIWDDAVSAAWDRIALHDGAGSEHRYDLAPYRYVLIRSRDYGRVAAARLDGVDRRQVAVDQIEDGADVAIVRGADAAGRPVEIAARWVFDTRPARPARRGTVSLLQHFRGWFVRTPADAFDPSVATLMDFRLPQPRGGVAFGYLLPTSPRTALVEYTEFSARPLSTPEYEDALRRYTADVLGLGAFDVTGAEQGVIPMTDAPFPRRVGRRVFRLGAAGGATRPATGYTFQAAQRQARSVADALLAGRDPGPPRAYPRRHLWMDGVLLRALAQGRVDGARFLTDLFDRHPTPRVLRFLDGETSPREDLAVMVHSPRRPMLTAAIRRR